jgi:hypothetical protein
MRSPSIFSDCSVRPSFLRTTPAKKPRTECCCQPVEFMIAAIVVPFGWLSSAMTVACLEFERYRLMGLVCCLLAGRANFEFLDDLGLVGCHVGILSWLNDGILCRHHRSPAAGL